MKRKDIHESYIREETVERPPDRQFGVVFAIVFGLIGVLPLLSGRPVRWWSVVVAVGFLGCAVTAPGVLAPLNRVWLLVGLFLHRVMTPLVLGLVFFSTVLPIGLVFRALGKDPLRLKFDPDATTYWIARRPHGPAGHTMSNQY